jgi:hypothetical protein
MPVLNRPDGTIRYETHGRGFPVLLFAPGGLRSRLDMWPAPPGGPPRPWVDWTQALPAAGFTAIAMDQRNAGESRAARPDLNEDAIAAFGRNMWDHDFVFCVDRAFARDCPVPTLLLPGTDIPHPAATSAELAALLPGVEVLTDWRGPQHLDQQEARVVAFLRRHTPHGSAP